MASSNEGTPMLEVMREAMSTTIYQYQLVDFKFLGPTIIFGIKELSRIGVTSLTGIITPIEYNTLKGYLSTGMLWNKKYMFSPKELTSQELNTLLLLSQDKQIESVSSKTKGVWVYDSKTMKLITYEPTVKSCLTKYNISSTHFKRIRKFGTSYNGMIFSTVAL